MAELVANLPGGVEEANVPGEPEKLAFVGIERDGLLDRVDTKGSAG